MSSYNHVTLIGNLGEEPQTRYIPGGKTVCNFSLAVNEYYRDAAGEKVDSAHWFRVACWDKTAELAGEHLRKGSRVLVDGRLKTRYYLDRDGVKRYVVDVVANRLVFLDSVYLGQDPEPEPAGVGADLEEPPF